MQRMKQKAILHDLSRDQVLGRRCILQFRENELPVE